MRQLTVDVNVLVHGSVPSDPTHLPCNDLMRALEGRIDCKLIMDSEERIYRQYSKHLKGRPYGVKWLKSMLSNGRVVHLDRAHIDNSIRIRFAERGFVGEDYDNFVRTCAASCCKVIASYDPDFSAVEKLLWKQLGIRLRSATDARRFAVAGRCERCDGAASSGLAPVPSEEA